MDTIERLRQVSLFNQLSATDFTQLKTIVQRARYLTGAVVCLQGGIGSTLYIVDSGSIEVLHVDSRNRQRTLDPKHAGDTFGEAALLIGEPYKTTFVAHEDSDVLSIRREDLHDLMLQCPNLRAPLNAGTPPEILVKIKQPHFDWLMEGELTILRARKHWWAFIHDLPRASIVVFLTLAIAIVVTAFSTDLMILAIAWGMATFISSLALAFVFIDWRNDDYIVTNRRIIHLERILFVRTEQREATLDKIQNVQIRQPTFVQKAIGVSDVVISTTAVHGTITFSAVSNGPNIKDAIFEQMQRMQAQKKFEAREKLKKELRDQFEEKPVIIKPVATSASVWGKPPRRPLRIVIAERFALRFENAGTVTFRKHPLALFLQAWKPAIGTLVAFITSILILFGIIPLPPMVDLVMLAVMLVFGGWFLWEFIDWENDIYTLTKDRIADIERTPLGVIQHSNESPLLAIQNVSYLQPNIMFVFLNIGEVVVDTGSQTSRLTFPWMSPPAKVANEISQYVDRARERQNQTQRAQQRADMFQWFGAYNEYLKEEDRGHRDSPPASNPGTGPTGSESTPAGSSSQE